MDDADVATKEPVQDVSHVARIRRWLLFALLGVMVIAIVYDYVIARPAVAIAYDQITVESRFRNSQANQTFSNQDMHKLMGRAPSRKFQDGSHLVEVYDFTSGIPGRPHQLFTVFTVNGDSHLFYRHAKFAYETRHDVASIADNQVMEITPDVARQMNAVAAAEAAEFGRQYRALQQSLGDEQLAFQRQVDQERGDRNGDGEVSQQELQEQLSDESSQPDPTRPD